jgi:hypothetical protein
MTVRRDDSGKWMVKWGDTEIDWEESKAKSAEAKEIAKEFRLTTTEERQWYEDSWTETVINHFELARLIEKIRSEK